MSIRDIIKGKKEWRSHMDRVNELPSDFRIAYKEMQKYIFKVSSSEQSNMSVLVAIVDLFEEGASLGKNPLKITGANVSGFCDELLKSVD